MSNKHNLIPDDILNNHSLNQDIARLPKNYSFEIHKSVWRLRMCKAKKVALQFPEGLLMYSCLISDILQKHCNVETLIMGDVTYGACCIDDYTALSLDCDFMIHYGHSCLVPIDVANMNSLYVFVDIGFDISHLCSLLLQTFPVESKLLIAGTIQFSSALNALQKVLAREFAHLRMPQCKPLSQGEVLGCTSPSLQLEEDEICIFLADGRFHLESLMIHNPKAQYYKYDPYNRMLTKEGYDYAEMQSIRYNAITKCKNATKWGVVLGTLGRQGSYQLLERIERLFNERGLEYTVIQLSELFPQKLAQMNDIQGWVQVACPRLSIDWGYAFTAPLLSTYELDVCLGLAEWLPNGVYPMDYYSDTAGPWGNYHERVQQGKKSVNCEGEVDVTQKKTQMINKLRERARLRKLAAEQQQLQEEQRAKETVVAPFEESKDIDQIDV